MQHLVLLLATLALMSHHISCRAANIKKQFRMLPVDLTDENIEEDGASPITPTLIEFASIKKKPPPSMQRMAGEVLELSCKAIGSPAPSLQWLRNDEPIADHDLDSSEVFVSTSSSIAQITGTLIISTPSPNDIDVYTCLVTAGRHTDAASTTVLNIELNSIKTERSKLPTMAPKIVTFYEAYMDKIGQSALFPCRVKGHPRPLVTWFDNNGNIIKNHTRMKVLKSGELSISELNWKDMGDFKCQATNWFGTSSKYTFVYPYKEGEEGKA